VLQRLRERFSAGVTAADLRSRENEIAKKERALEKRENSIIEKREALKKQEKEYKRISRMEERLKSQHISHKSIESKLLKKQKEWEHKERAHKSWKEEHLRVMEQLNLRAQRIEEMEDGLKLERERIVQQQRLLERNEDRLSRQSKILKQMIGAWEERIHPSGFKRDEEKMALEDTWLRQMAVKMQASNLSESVRFIE